LSDEEAKKSSRRKALAKISDYQKTFNDPIGKKVLYDMMQEHFMLKSTFVKNDTHATAMHEGERNVVLRLMTILKMDPKQIEQKISESEGYE
jgi:hypothetical protein